MQQIFNTILKNKNLILFISLFVFSIFFLRNRSLYHKSKIDKSIIEISGNIHGISAMFNRYFNLKKINEELLAENKKLIELRVNKKNIQDVELKTIYNVYDAEVVKNSIKSSRNYLIINKGSKDSIQKEMGVISSKGIIGVVSSVSENYSSVVSILNIDLNINAKFKKNNAFGSLNWNGTNTNKVTLNNIPIINKVEMGDSILTGGMSTYFPEGIFIGLVSGYKIIQDNGYYEIDVTLNNRVANEINVFVIRNIHQKEIKSLE